MTAHDLREGGMVPEPEPELVVVRTGWKVVRELEH